MAQEQLYENRDLNMTTDFRDVLGELVTRHLGNRQITAVFRGWWGSFKGGIDRFLWSRLILKEASTPGSE